jgi:hypothetical protein
MRSVNRVMMLVMTMVFGMMLLRHRKTSKA